MTDLTAVIHTLTALFDRMSLPYAIMGGIVVRARGKVDEVGGCR